MHIDPERPIYIIDEYCAERLRSLLEQLRDVVTEALDRRRFDPAGRQDFGLEEVDMGASISNFQTEDLEELF
jgi:hypothetical protein